MNSIRIVLKVLLTLFIFFIGTATNLSAESTTGCHCFKDRKYDPLNKYAADDYILATSFNSLLSSYFKISKRQIVMLKMKGGNTNDDLLIGLSISKASTVPINNILTIRKDKKSWQQVVDDPILSSHQLPTFMKNMSTLTTTSKAAIKIGNKIISEYFHIPLKKVKQFRAEGFSEKEIALLSVLSKTKNVAPENIIKQRSKEGKSWSEISNLLKVEPAAAGKLIIDFNPKK